MEARRGTRNGILSLAIKDKAVLYAAYMPFVRNGGLFIPTKKEYELGDEVFMLLNLMDEAEKIPVAGKVVVDDAQRRAGKPRRRHRRPVQRPGRRSAHEDRNLSRRRAAIGSAHAHDVGVLVDSHCHLDLLDDPDTKLAAARAVGVDAVLCISVGAAAHPAVLALAQRHPDVWASAGVHPESVSDESLDWVQAAARLERIVGIGETGLDYLHAKDDPEPAFATRELRHAPRHRGGRRAAGDRSHACRRSRHPGPAAITS